MNVTFVLPGSGRSGGIRVTVEMANRLALRGYRTRIAYHREPARNWRDRLRRFRERVEFGLIGDRGDWLRSFSGPTLPFQDLRTIPFADGEIVIAVGTRCILEVHRLPPNVVKLRYCHGFSDYLREMTETAWTLSMGTLAVSPLLIPRLRGMGCEVLGVVPNGISPDEYFVEPADRRGVGLIFNDNPKKAPGETLALIAAIRRELPEVPCHVFSHNRWREGIPRETFRRLPTVAEARQIYNRCKVWTITSQSEGFCLPILEAMACGTAVVSSDHDTAPGLIRHQHNGYLVPFGDTPAFMARIRELLADETTRQRLVQEGFRTAAEYSWDRAVDQMESVLRPLESSARAAGTAVASRR